MPDYSAAEMARALLKQAMTDDGVSYAKLARRLKCNHSTLYKTLNDPGDMRLSTVFKIANALHRNVAFHLVTKESRHEAANSPDAR